MTARLTRRQLLTGAGATGLLAACGKVPPPPPAAARSAYPGAGLGSRPASATPANIVLVDGVALPSAGWLIRENARPGTRTWPVAAHQTPYAIEGYAGTVSTTPGTAVPLFVNTAASTVTVEAYRMGWYGGVGGRLLWRSDPFPGRRQPAPGPAAGTNMIECSWAPSLTVPVGRDWPPGVYLLKLVGDGGAAHGGPEQYVPLTVRDDTSTAAFTFTNAVTTWQAYNRWGGYSLYVGGPAASYPDRARVVSFDRPYPSDFGNGAGDLIGNELPLLFLLERHGLDVTYWTDIDLHARGELLLHRGGALLSLGHDEYWSAAMYDIALAARDAGVNFAFFGANACYRHIRLDAGPNGPDRRQVCYKVATEDPLYGKDNAAVTANWPDAPVPRPESRLIGDMYQSFPAHGALVASDSWLFAGTGLAVGEGIPGVVGSEYDAYVPGPNSPVDLDVLAHSPIVVRGRHTVSDATWYTAPHGGGVFASGTANWVGLLADSRTAPMIDIVPATTPGVTAPLLRATVNVLNAVGHGPGSRSRPSTGTWRQYYS